MFKSGDKVKVKSLDEIRAINKKVGYNSPGINDWMKKYMGRVHTIDRLMSKRIEGAQREYQLVGDGHSYLWREDWLELYGFLSEDLFYV